MVRTPPVIDRHVRDLEARLSRMEALAKKNGWMPAAKAPEPAPAPEADVVEAGDNNEVSAATAEPAPARKTASKKKTTKK